MSGPIAAIAIGAASIVLIGALSLAPRPHPPYEVAPGLYRACDGNHAVYVAASGSVTVLPYGCKTR